MIIQRAMPDGSASNGQRASERGVMRITVEVSDGALTSVTTSPPSAAQPGAPAPAGAAADVPVINAGPAPAASRGGTAAAMPQGVSAAAAVLGQGGISAGPSRALPQ